MRLTHSHHEMIAGQERRAVHLKGSADQIARRSARRYGVVVSLAQMAELRHAIAKGPLPETIRYVGQTGTSFDAYVVDS